MNSFSNKEQQNAGRLFLAFYRVTGSSYAT